MSASIPTTWPQLKAMAGEFFRALPGATEKEAEAGFKCLTLGYFGLECGPLDRVQAEHLMRIGQVEFDKQQAAGFRA
jgi:hypothetical protein